jgi:tRNA (cmo5U34)-methyltransferase
VGPAGTGYPACVSVASHLSVSPAGYDRRIRGLIPRYEELIGEAARALILAERPVRRIVDLGVGTGALASACLDVAPAARVTGLDVDPSMTAMARRRLGRRASQVTIRHASFLETTLPACDAIVASYSLHHIRTRSAKAAFYRRCFRALRGGGVLISGDCFPPSSRDGWKRDVDDWITHLARTFGTRAAARRELESWQDEDTYVPLADEIRMLARAGFRVEVVWRKSPFAVLVGRKPRSNRGS